MFAFSTFVATCGAGTQPPRGRRTSSPTGVGATEVDALPASGTTNLVLLPPTQSHSPPPLSPLQPPSAISSPTLTQQRSSPPTVPSSTFQPRPTVLDTYNHRLTSRSMSLNATVGLVSGLGSLFRSTPSTNAPRPPPRTNDGTSSYEGYLLLDAHSVPRGINKTFQHRILREVTYRGPTPTPTSTPTTCKEEDMCLICRDTLQVGVRVVQLQCTHMYHRGCLEPWLERERTCPCCRSEVYPKAVP